MAIAADAFWLDTNHAQGRGYNVAYLDGSVSWYSDASALLPTIAPNNTGWAQLETGWRDYLSH